MSIEIVRTYVDAALGVTVKVCPPRYVETVKGAVPFGDGMSVQLVDVDPKKPQNRCFLLGRQSKPGRVRQGRDEMNAARTVAKHARIARIGAEWEKLPQTVGSLEILAKTEHTSTDQLRRILRAAGCSNIPNLIDIKAAQIALDGMPKRGMTKAEQDRFITDHYLACKSIRATSDRLKITRYRVEAALKSTGTVTG